MEKEIFISYNSNNFNFVKDIYEELKKNGQLVWFDKHDIKPSDIWLKNLKKAIRECILVLIYIENEIGPFQENEICIAIIREVCQQCRIMQVKNTEFEDEDNNNEILVYLNNFQFIKLTPKFKTNATEKTKLNHDLNSALHDIRKLLEQKKNEIILGIKTKLCEKELRDYLKTKLCEKKLRDYLTRIDFVEFKEYKKELERVRDKFTARKKFSYIFTIIGNNQVFEVHKSIIEKIFGEIEIYEVSTEQTFQSVKDLKNNERRDYKIIYLNTIWKQLGSRAGLTCHKNDDQRNKIIEGIINKIENIDKTVCISVTVESKSSNLMYIKHACDSFAYDLNNIAKRNDKPIIFFMCVKGDIANNDLAYCYKPQYDFRCLNINDLGTTEIKKKEYDDYVRLCCLKKIIQFIRSNNSETLLEELNQLICKKEEIYS